MLRFHRRFLLLSGGAALAACASPRSLGPLRPTVSFEALARQMKYDVGTYIYQHQDEPAVYGGLVESDPEAEVENARIRADPTKRLMTEKEKCHAQLAFTIYSVRITTIALVNNSFTPEAGLQVPLNVGTIDLSVKAGIEGEDTITTSLEIVPDENEENYRISKPTPVREFSGTPIADTLNALRTDLLRTADTEPCFAFGPGGDQKNSVKWGFAIKNSATVGGKLSIALFAIGADNTLTQSVTNSIEVSFNGHGGFG